MRADLAAVPVQLSGIDLQSAADGARLVKQAQSVIHQKQVIAGSGQAATVRGGI